MAHVLIPSLTLHKLISLCVSVCVCVCVWKVASFCTWLKAPQPLYRTWPHTCPYTINPHMATVTGTCSMRKTARGALLPFNWIIIHSAQVHCCFMAVMPCVALATKQLVGCVKGSSEWVRSCMWCFFVDIIRAVSVWLIDHGQRGAGRQCRWATWAGATPLLLCDELSVSDSWCPYRAPSSYPHPAYGSTTVRNVDTELTSVHK